MSMVANSVPMVALIRTAVHIYSPRSSGSTVTLKTRSGSSMTTWMGPRTKVRVRGIVISGSFDGAHREIEIAGFLTVTNNMLSELRFVTDLTTINELRKAAGLRHLD